MKRGQGEMNVGICVDGVRWEKAKVPSCAFTSQQRHLCLLGTRLPRAAVESPSLEGFKKCVDGALREVV